MIPRSTAPLFPGGAFFYARFDSIRPTFAGKGGKLWENEGGENMEQERQVLRLPAADIRPNPRQPRRVFEERGLRELSSSIRRHGILQPLTVRRCGEEWELVAGERRLRAARMAGLETVPCIEAEVDEEESALLALIENLQRRDLHYFEEAEAVADYIRRSGVMPPSSSSGRRRGSMARLSRRSSRPAEGSRLVRMRR